MGPRTGPRGAPIEDDETTWDRWWEFNHDAFLPANPAVLMPQTGADAFYLGTTRQTAIWSARLPTRDVVEQSILPALKTALLASHDRDLTDACMLALARIGIDRRELPLTGLFVPRLADADQTVRETAALALGLAGGTDRYRQDVLAGLARNDVSGQQLGGGTISERTRAFAAYGLGLAANETADIRQKQRAFEVLAGLLDDADAGREVKVAAIHALGLFELDPRKYQEVKLGQAALAALEGYFGRDVSGTERVVQAHCPTAIARLLRRDSPLAQHFKELFASELSGKSSMHRHGHLVAQSCALALGRIVLPDDRADSVDAEFSKVLLDAYHDHKDVQTRNFAVLALGQIGGTRNREALLRAFDRASKTQAKPWCALALGLLTHDGAGHGGAGHDAVVDRFVGEALADALKVSKDPGLTGALAIALGLAHVTDAAKALRERLLASVPQEQLAGCLCECLSMLGDKRVTADLQTVVAQAQRRPELLEQAAIALGRLGDARIAPMLEQRLAAGDGNIAELAAIGKALAAIGDARSVPAMVELLANRSASDVVRAHAAAVLGGIADRRTLPWNAPIATNANYRAAVATFTDQVAGVLDVR